MADPAPHNPPDSTRATLGQFLKFMGLMMTIGASLAILRTLRVDERVWFEGLPWFFAALMPAGLVVWGVGFWLSQK